MSEVEEIKVGDFVKCFCSYTKKEYYGFVTNVFKDDNGHTDFTVLSYNCGKLWGIGVHSQYDVIEKVGYNITDLINNYLYWLFDECWKNTDHSEFRKFLKFLKKIRKKSFIQKKSFI